jgi:hypothetical protein
LHGLQIGEDPSNRARARIASEPKVEHKAGVAHDVAPKAGRGDATLAQKFFDFPE